MAVGTPVVGTATGGSAEYLRDGENCLVFEPGDAAGLASAVRRLAADAALRDRLRSGGRRTAARFTDHAFQELYLETLVSVAARAGARA
jgi:glycosyltransferase involved in cell wall biosynthesis